MKILLISGGTLDVDAMAGVLAGETWDHIVAIDGGLDRFAALRSAIGCESFKLTHIVGDFDTVDADVLAQYRESDDIEIRQFKPEKDYTDTDIALKLALELCMKEPEVLDRHQIVMIGCTGTRLDHTLSNFHSLKIAMDAGVDAVMLDSHNRIRMIQGIYNLRNCYGKYVSILPITMELRGVTLRGLKYTLTDKDVFLGESLCVSNEMKDDVATIEIREGVALLIESRD